MSGEPELFVGVQVRDEAAHWDALAQRVAAAALAESEAGAVERLGRSPAGWLAAAMLLIAALSYFAAPEPASAATAPDWAQAIAPADDVGRAMATPGAPPSIGALVIAESAVPR